MITNEQLEYLKIESKLSGTFCMANDSDGKRWVVFGNQILDSAAFNAMLLSYFYGNTSRLKKIITRSDYNFLRYINGDDPSLPSDYFINRLSRQFFKVVGTRSKKEIIKRFAECIEICKL